MNISKVCYRDRVFIVASGVLMLLGVLVVLLGNRVLPGVLDVAYVGDLYVHPTSSFTFTFSEPVDTGKIEENFVVQPPIEGRFSWNGKRMMFTPLAPLPSATRYAFSVDNIEGISGRVGVPYDFEVETAPRELFFISADEDTMWRLARYRMDAGAVDYLTSDAYLVTGYAFGSNSTVYVTAIDRRDFNRAQALVDQQKIYAVALDTGTMELLPGQDRRISYTMSTSPSGALGAYQLRISETKDLLGSGLFFWKEGQWKEFWFKEGVNDMFYVIDDGAWVLQQTIFDLVLASVDGDQVLPVGQFVQVFDVEDERVLLEVAMDVPRDIVLLQDGKRNTVLQGLFVHEADFRSGTEEFFYSAFVEETKRFGLFRWYDDERQVEVVVDDEVSIGKVDVSADGQLLAVEGVPLDREEVLVNVARGIYEQQEYELIPTALYILDLVEEKKYALPLKGREPRWR